VGIVWRGGLLGAGGARSAEGEPGPAVAARHDLLAQLPEAGDLKAELVPWLQIPRRRLEVTRPRGSACHDQGARKKRCALTQERNKLRNIEDHVAGVAFLREKNSKEAAVRFWSRSFTFKLVLRQIPVRPGRSAWP